MAEITLASIIVAETADAIYRKMLQVASSLGLVTESWASGDPTRSTFDAVSRQEASKESSTIEMIKAGFLDLASGNGLKLCARYLFNTEYIQATFATCTVRLNNAGAQPYEFEVGDVIVGHNTSDKTYTATDIGTGILNPGGTLEITVTADEAGSASSAGIGDITTMVTSFPKVTCTNLTAAVGVDEESDAALKARAKAKLAALSPNGPADAYAYVATTPDLVNGQQITRVRVLSDSTNGDVTIYIAGASGAVAGGVVTDVQDGIDTWANPHNNEPTVSSAVNETIAITYALWVYESISESAESLEERIELALAAAMKERPIGGDVLDGDPTGNIYVGWIESVILGEVGREKAFRVSVTTPATDVALAINDVPILGTVTPTINFVADP